MNEREAREAVRPHGSVRRLTTSPGAAAPTARTRAPGGENPVLHPLRGSEDEATYTEAQRDTLKWFVDAHDEVKHRLLPDGHVLLETIDYDDGGQTIHVHTVSRGGIPL